MSASSPADLLVPLAQGAAVVAYGLCQLGLAVYSSHRYSLLWRRGARSSRWLAPASAGAADLPVVTVQLPLYNERFVAERLIAAAAALEYAPGRLEIQVLDDSTDATVAIVAAAVARARAAGVDIVHVRRAGREGYKAGALAAGLAIARGELVAVFDADFVPPPDFLLRMLPHFADPRVGMAQARWGHLNRAHSALTSGQAVMLDAHFLLEHPMRMQRGLFFNFNGTAGVWRRACIEDAGGWSHDTLTEDLDLSYRAQLCGWRFVFDPLVVVPAELPADMPAFKTQQRRWAKGSIQTARKLLPGVFAAPLPLAVKVEAFFHLTSNTAYPLLVALGFLLLPVMLAHSALSSAAVWALQIGVLLFGIVPIALFLAAGQRAAGERGPRVLRDVLAAVVLGVGLSLNNARAVLEGLGSRVGEWERTPKTGDVALRRRGRRYAAAGAHGRGEMLVAGYFAALLAWAAWAGQARALPFIALLALGHAWVGAGSVGATRAARAARR